MTAHMKCSRNFRGRLEKVGASSRKYWSTNCVAMLWDTFNETNVYKNKASLSCLLHLG
jgi:hypothetical protein